MRHEWTGIVVDGFGSGEVDFAQRLASLPQEFRDEFDEVIMRPLINGVNGGVILTINGYADRVDTGASHRDALQLESDAGWRRAKSAEDSVFAMIGRDWIDPAPSSWDDLPYIAVYSQSRGAVWLLDHGGDESARRRNRRVELRVCRHLADA